MKTSAKKIILTAIATAAVATMSVPAEAGCGGGSRRGGISIGFGGSRGGLSLGISQSHYGSRSRKVSVQRHAPVQQYAPVQHHAPVQHYTTAQHNTPVYQPAPVTYSAPLQQSRVISSSTPQTQPTFRQPSVSQPSGAIISSQPIAQQQQSAQSAEGRTVASQPASQQRTGQQPTVQQPTAPQPVTKPVTEASALAMLASINQSESKPATSQIPQFSAGSAAKTKPHVGNWGVSLPGNQTVTLNLSSNNSFIWTATKDGTSSSFHGQYRLEGDRLSLVRSSDSQKMEGSWTAGDNGFVFRVDGENTGGLSFTALKN